MLQNMRDNMKGTLGAIVIGLICLTLMLSFGFSILAPSPTGGGEVASVNGESIGSIELQRAIISRKSQLQAQFGDSLPENFISDEALREPVLDSLINRQVLALAAKDAGLAVSDQRVNQMLREAPDFQVDGRFDQNRYRQLVTSVGFTPVGYQLQVKEDIVLNQLTSGLASTGFVTEKQLRHTTRLSQQKRDFYYLTVPLSTVLSTVEVSDEQAMAHYEENKDSYQNPEEVSIEYIELRLSDIADGIEVSESELRQQFEQELAAFTANVERQAAHILIEEKEDGSEQQVLADIQSRIENGEEFANLAEEFSEDFGSSGLGGDLGYSAGDTFPPEFEQALVALEVGAVSAPVKTDSGFHLIKLLDVRGDVAPTFEEDKDRIARALKNSLAEEEYLELTQELEDLSYNATDLSEVASSLGLEAKQAGPFARTGGFGVAARQEVITEAFSDAVLNGGNTSPLIQLDNQHVLVLRKTDYSPVRTLAFEEVKAQVIEQVKQKLAREQVAAIGAEIEAEVKAGKSIEEAAKDREYEWQVSLNTQRTDPKVRRELLNYVFSLSKSQEAVTRGLSSNNGDYFVVNLVKVVDGDYSELETAEKQNLNQRLASLTGESDYAAFSDSLQAKADIER